MKMKKLEMKMKKLRPNGVMLENGIVLSYDDPNEFIEAWPGIFMMISVMKGEKVDNPAYKGVEQ